MGTLDKLRQWFSALDFEQPYMPVEIPGIGRDDLARMFNDLGFAMGVEVGTAEGRYAQVLCEAMPGLHLGCVDPYKAYHDFPDQKTMDHMLANAVKRLSKYPNAQILRTTSAKGSLLFEDDSLDFVYIDGNHAFDFVVFDIRLWLPKVRKGGIIAGHDYAKLPARCHSMVPEAVQHYTSTHNIRPWFTIGTAARIPGVYRDDIRSWMWVKEGK